MNLMKLLIINGHNASHTMDPEPVGVDCQSPGIMIDAGGSPTHSNSVGIETESEQDKKKKMEKNGTHPVVLRWRGSGDEVTVSGSYDNWQTKIPLVRSASSMFTVVDVPEGIHDYKFLVDGEWLCEHTEPTREDACFGENNVVSISSADCNVFAALKNDDDDGDESGPRRNAGDYVIGSPPDGYSQYIPPRDPGPFNLIRHGPPALPPHLLQSVLNSNSPDPSNTSVLAKPNHVVLNHTFTLSIRDGIMVLSATHRFRQKYITTVLYRPV